MRRLLLPLAASLFCLSAALAEPAPVAADPGGGHALGLQGAPNFRDLGGYATSDGRHLRRGLVYRSNKLSALTDADEARLEALHIAAEIDLRTLEERQKEPSRWLKPPADIYESPKPSLADDLKSLVANVHDVPSAHVEIDKFYARMPDLYREEYAAFFRRLLKGEEPLVVHCTAGKDRTGVAAAILLEALGVPRATVVADYTMTEKLTPPPPRSATANAGVSITMMDRVPDDARVELWRSEDEYILAALTSIDKEYGSVDGYVRKGLGLSAADIARLRATLTE